MLYKAIGSTTNIRPDIRKFIFSGQKIVERELDSENIEVEILLTDFSCDANEHFGLTFFK